MEKANEILEKSICGYFNIFFSFFGHLALAFSELMFLGVPPAIQTFLGMLPVKSVNLLILMSKRAFKQEMINLIHNVILIEFIWLKKYFF